MSGINRPGYNEMAAERIAEIEQLIDWMPLTPYELSEPTDARPGSPLKAAIMHHRHQLGLPLRHPNDAANVVTTEEYTMGRGRVPSRGRRNGRRIAR